MATVTGTDAALLACILRSLAATGAIKQAGLDIFTATNVSRTFADPGISDGSKFCFDVVEKAWQCLPEYLNQKGYREPCDASDCAIDIAFGNRQPIFEMLANDPSNLGRFNKFMTVQRRGRVSWLEFFPVEQQLIKGFSHKENVVIMVDVGGGHGHELQEIMNKYPKLPGRVILQDLRVTIDKVDAGPQMETMPHDFFTYQRIKGARAYYFRNIFHDWPDSRCKEILERTTAAMARDYSKILINEWCLGDSGSSV